MTHTLDVNLYAKNYGHKSDIRNGNVQNPFQNISIYPNDRKVTVLGVGGKYTTEQQQEDREVMEVFGGEWGQGLGWELFKKIRQP